MLPPCLPPQSTFGPQSADYPRRRRSATRYRSEWACSPAPAIAVPRRQSAHADRECLRGPHIEYECSAAQCGKILARRVASPKDTSIPGLFGGEKVVNEKFATLRSSRATARFYRQDEPTRLDGSQLFTSFPSDLDQEIRPSWRLALPAAPRKARPNPIPILSRSYTAHKT